VTPVPEDALRLFELGYRAHMEQRFEEAIAYYERSIAIHPTAEAHTFLGWVYSAQKRYDAAIAECEIAIRVDPDFGNPYNDIGAYLIELRRFDEAIPWLEKAKHARRYEPRHYPYFNLSRIYTRRGQIDDAIRELRGAIQIEPDYTIARKELHRLLGMLN
jgi:tetratricopeptide (TPR) repeat protein